MRALSAPSLRHGPALALALAVACDIADGPEHVRPADRTALPADTESPDGALGADAAAPDFLGSDSCRACHPAAWESWHRSHHRRMTQPATDETVLGDWEGTTLERQGRRFRLYREDGRFMVDMPAMGTEGRHPTDRWQRPVEMTTGSHHMQLYWLRVPWADGNSPGAPLFAERCARCHTGEATLEGRRLRPAELRRPVLSPASDDHILAVHGLGAADKARLTDHVQALQHTDRLAQLPFAWFVREQRWIHEDDSFLQPPLEDEEVQPYTEGWSDGCDRCHSVEPWAAFSEETATASAAVAELGIACEACHGPGRAHATAQRDPLSRYASHLGLGAVDDIVQPAALAPDRANSVCGQCHAELVPLATGRLSDAFAPGDDLHAVAHVWQWEDDTHRAALPPAAQQALDAEPDVLDNAFWADGTVRIAGRDLNGMLATACVTEGEMSCLSCHSLHGGDPDDQLKPGATGAGPAGDAACLDCHPGLDTPAHTHHPVESTGARCMNCHMPHTTIGLLTVMRAHRVDSPSAERSRFSGRPSACNLCHLDQSLAWTAATLADWSGASASPAPAAAVPQSFDQALRGDAAQRAVWAWHLGWAPAQAASGSDWPAGLLIELVTDPYVAVRTIARARLQEDARFAGVDWDPARAPAELAPVQARLRARWQQSMGGRNLPALFIENGVMDEQKVARWLLLRDDRDVVVNE